MSKKIKLSRQQQNLCWGITCTVLFGAVLFFYTPIKTWVATWLPTVFVWGMAAILFIAAVVSLFNSFFAVSDEREEEEEEEEDILSEDGTTEEGKGGDDE